MQNLFRIFHTSYIRHQPSDILPAALQVCQEQQAKYKPVLDHVVN